MRRKRLIGVWLIITALIIMLLPVSEADAASSASDFVIDRETLKKYKGTDKTVKVPDSVEIIGEGAFQENTDIEKVVLPDSVKGIEAYAFWGCDNLKTVTLGKGMTEIGDMAFTNCTGLETMTIPSNIRRIGLQAFAYCQRLEDITIPAEVTDIREDAFDGDYLLNIRCEAGSYADKYAQEFYESQKKMPVYADPEEDKDTSDDGSGSLDGTFSPSGDVLGSTHVVGNQAVVLIQNTGLNVLGGRPEETAGAENGDSGNPGAADNSPAWQVAERAHYRDSGMTEEQLDEGILEIASFAYARSGLTRVSLPEGLERIGYAAFYHCDDLAEVVLPETVTAVSPKAFDHTAWVENFLGGEGDSPEDSFLISGGVLVAYRGEAEEVTVPEGVRVIAGEAFADHIELRKIHLPKSLQTIGERAFANCSLESVTYEGNAISEDILEEHISLTDLSAPPVKAQAALPWTRIGGCVLMLAGFFCVMGRPRALRVRVRQ